MPDDGTGPKLDIKNVISILISSDFLQMKGLVQECIDFVIENLHDVVRLPIDMNCLNQNLKRVQGNSKKFQHSVVALRFQ